LDGAGGVCAFRKSSSNSRCSSRGSGGGAGRSSKLSEEERFGQQLELAALAVLEKTYLLTCLFALEECQYLDALDAFTANIIFE